MCCSATAMISGGPMDWAIDWARHNCTESAVVDAIEVAADRPPVSYMRQQGWVLVALQNAFFQLLHATSLDQGVVATVRAGGDTDTNGAIFRALLRSLHRPHPLARHCHQIIPALPPLAR